MSILAQRGRLQELHPFLPTGLRSRSGITVCVCVCVCMCVCESLSRVRLFATPWTVACQDPLSMEFSRQEYWSGLPFLSLVAPGKSCLLLGDSGSKAVHSLQPLGEIDAYTDISLLWIR